MCFSASTSASCRSGQWDVALGLLLDSVWKGFQTSVIILNSAEARFTFQISEAAGLALTRRTISPNPCNFERGLQHTATMINLRSQP